jgi:hypothetical protein
MIFRALIFLSLLILTVSQTFAASPWDFYFDATLGFYVDHYSGNWPGGDLGVVKWLARTDFIAQAQLGKRIFNRQQITLRFGQAHYQDDQRNWMKAIKFNDWVEVQTQWRLTLGKFFDPYVSGWLQTQFVDQSDPTHSISLNPLKLNESVGFARYLIFTKKVQLDARAGPGFRQTIYRDIYNPLSGTRFNQTTSDAGAQLDLDFIAYAAQGRIAITSRFNLYQAFFNSRAKDLENSTGGDNWEQPDIYWENRFRGSITDYLGVEFYLLVLFDREIDASIMHNETLSLNLIYSIK